MSTHQKSRNKAKCPRCQKTFFTMWNLRQHVIQFHPDFPVESISDDTLEWKSVKKMYCTDLPTCKICKRSFPKKYNLEQHMNAFHTGRRSKNICSDCGIGFARPSSILRHRERCNCNEENDTQKPDDQNIVAAEAYDQNDSGENYETVRLLFTSYYFGFT